MKKNLMLLLCLLFLSGCDFLGEDFFWHDDFKPEEEKVLETPKNLKAEIKFRGYYTSEPMYEIELSWDKVEDCNGYYVEVLDANTKVELDSIFNRHIEGNDCTKTSIFFDHLKEDMIMEFNVYAVDLINHSTPELYHYEITASSKPAQYYYNNREGESHYKVGYYMYNGWELKDAFYDVVGNHLERVSEVLISEDAGSYKKSHYVLEDIVLFTSEGNYPEDGYATVAGSATFFTTEMLLKVSKVENVYEYDEEIYDYKIVSSEKISTGYQTMQLTRINDTYGKVDDNIFFDKENYWDFVYGFQYCDVKVSPITTIKTKEDLDQTSARILYSVLIDELVENVENKESKIYSQLKNLIYNKDGHVEEIDKYTFRSFSLNNVYLLDYNSSIYETADSTESKPKFDNRISFRLIYTFGYDEVISLNVSIDYIGDALDKLSDVGNIIKKYYNDENVEFDVEINDLDYIYYQPSL